MKKPPVRIFGVMSKATLNRLNENFVVSYFPSETPDLSVKSDAVAIVTRGHIVIDEDFMNAHPSAKLSYVRALV